MSEYGRRRHGGICPDCGFADPSKGHDCPVKEEEPRRVYTAAYRDPEGAARADAYQKIPAIIHVTANGQWFPQTYDHLETTEYYSKADLKRRNGLLREEITELETMLRQVVESYDAEDMLCEGYQDLHDIAITAARKLVKR